MAGAVHPTVEDCLRRTTAGENILSNGRVAIALGVRPIPRKRAIRTLMIHEIIASHIVAVYPRCRS
jgi:hypothetical protein